MKRNLLSFSLCVLLATSARSDDAEFHRYDLDRNGKVTTTELSSPAAFRRYDADQNGEITLEEYRAIEGAAGATTEGGNRALRQIEETIKAVDKNADGRITKEEAGTAPWFSRVDRNGDGVIDAAEQDFVRKIAARGGERGGKTQPSPNPTITPEEVAEVTSGPEVLKPGDVGIGRMIADATAMDLDGKPHRLGESMGAKGLVIVMTSATCPLSKRYLPGVAKEQEKLDAQGFGLLLVNPFASESADEIKPQLAEHGITATYVLDREKSVSATLAAQTTTEVFLLDPKRTLIYRGALDDQFGINYLLEAPRHRYLDDAISALLAGETPAIEATAAPGCEIDLPEAGGPASLSTVTYHRDVARILQQNCVQCHRDGGIAPFALEEVEEVKDRARVIKRVVSEGTMPPWFAVLEPGAESNPWANDCSLSERDKSDLIAWIDSKDRPLGDPAEAPTPRTYPAEWSIGTPDLIVPLSRAYEIPATGFMPYQFNVVQTELTEDQWVTAYEILPSERDVVHHVIVQVHEKGDSVRNVGEGTGGYWAIYVPGNGSHAYPEGFARKIPAGAKISFQIHYTPSGTAKQERLRLGLVFAKEAPRYEVKGVGIAHQGIAIPPGAERHIETKTRTLDFDMPLTSFMPHMHVRGSAFSYEVTYPDGKTETLLDIPRYDFNWQLRYDYKTPKLIPRGSTFKITAVYNNSESNQANPDPTKLVKWGPQTVDEMMLGYLEYFIPVAAKVAAK